MGRSVATTPSANGSTYGLIPWWTARRDPGLLEVGAEAPQPLVVSLVVAAAVRRHLTGRVPARDVERVTAALERLTADQG